MALRRALKLVRGLRKQITELDERIMTTKLLDELHIIYRCLFVFWVGEATDTSCSIVYGLFVMVDSKPLCAKVLGCPRERAQRHRFIVGIKKPVACGGDWKGTDDPRETTTLVFELAFATALAFGVGEILHSMVGLPMQLALPLGEFIWGLIVFYFVS
jgi:hypothetical protein